MSGQTKGEEHMTKDEALKLALEALENAIAVRHGKDGTKFVDPLESNVITAIKEALAQPEQEPRNFCPRCGKRTPDPTTIHTCTPPRGLEMT
jgi:hypothetical protein